MKAFEFCRAHSEDEAVELAGTAGMSRFIAGGTNLVDLLKMGIETPDRVIDISALPLKEIAPTAEGGLRIGALVSNADLAAHPAVRRDYPVLSRAILAGASGQLRNMATAGGNLLQKPRCPYFYDLNHGCWRRDGGAACSAENGLGRKGIVLGGAQRCVAPHPGDMSVALSVLDAVVETTGPNGRRAIPLDDFYAHPDDGTGSDTVLDPQELVVAIRLGPPAGGQQRYRKVRDRASYAFALVSVASVIGPAGRVAIALGGVAHKPWRDREAERLAETDGVEAMIRALTAGADRTGPAGYKIALVERLVRAALSDGRDAA